MSAGSIVLEGVTTHNLRSVDVEIPKGRFVVVSGVSGSGKSSLIIDTLFEHSKSLYLGALSSRSLDMGDGDYHFDRISGTQPPVALRQRDGGYANPRSTVGTLTGLDGLHRILFGAGSQPVCPVCMGKTAADLRCPRCGVIAEPHTAKHFSPNRAEGRCVGCDGLGEMVGFLLDLVVPDRSQTLTEIFDGADKGTFAVPNMRKAFEAMADDVGIDLDAPFDSLTPEQVDAVLHGTDAVYTLKVRKVTNDLRCDGILGSLERAHRNASTAARRKAFANYLTTTTCPTCSGGRLRPESLHATVAGQTFPKLQQADLSTSTALLEEALADGAIAAQVCELAASIVQHGRNVVDVGLGHLSLQRPVVTLSGGELQRLLLAQHLASELTGVLYVLDEPTAGLHEHDTGRIIASLQRLRDLGNTVVAIEHDESVIRAADWVIEIGPGAGARGGEVVYSGPVVGLLDVEDSPTRAALSAGPEATSWAPPDGTGWIEVRDVSRNNVSSQTVKFPLGGLTCVSGVSGAGKSSLVAEVHAAVARAVEGGPVRHEVVGADALRDVILVEQRPVGRSSRSSVATFVGVSDHVRDAFAASTGAEELGLSRSDFSTNVAGGRCESCKGLGLAEIELTLFRSEHVVCPECDGRRFQDHVLEVEVDGRDIFQVLSMTVEEALDWFEQLGVDRVTTALSILVDFGLGYLQLGSSTTTLSGGEAQRLNLAGELLGQRRSGTLFLFDEPTRGLHSADIGHLLRLFERLISSGNTVLVIEHNLRVISIADWVVDVGPGAGLDGGEVLHCGTPADLAEQPRSVTGRYLRPSGAGANSCGRAADEPSRRDEKVAV